jgi:hypothetical protein
MAATPSSEMGLPQSNMKGPTRQKFQYAAASLPARSAESWRMSDPIPGNDPNTAYDVVPAQGWPHGWTVTCNGIPVRYFVNKTNAERYATDAEYRASLIVTKYAGR